MKKIKPLNIDINTINKVGLILSNKKINANICLDARVFEYPGLENVFIMENDLYGNLMPKGFCFLAFNGNHGLIGKQLKLETLKNSNIQDIKNIVNANNDG